ncbi:uncharacterized protein [Drosophila kikkawai]|uniref:Uncharacterized protein n=1 Tax=Drosophila kikkawai TaxID=30033 RepID=A0ABM4GMR1_DROKI
MTQMIGIKGAANGPVSETESSIKKKTEDETNEAGEYNGSVLRIYFLFKKEIEQASRYHQRDSEIREKSRRLRRINPRRNLDKLQKLRCKCSYSHMYSQRYRYKYS